MTEFDIWLKEMIEQEFELEEPIKEEYGNLVYKGKTFSLGQVTDPYLLYKYALWFNISDKNESVPLPENYKEEQVVREWLEKKLGLKRKEVKEPLPTPIVQEVKQEEDYPKDLFDLL